MINVLPDLTKPIIARIRDFVSQTIFLNSQPKLNPKTILDMFKADQGRQIIVKLIQGLPKMSVPCNDTDTACVTDFIKDIFQFELNNYCSFRNLFIVAIDEAPPFSYENEMRCSLMLTHLFLWPVNSFINRSNLPLNAFCDVSHQADYGTSNLSLSWRISTQSNPAFEDTTNKIKYKKKDRSKFILFYFR